MTQNLLLSTIFTTMANPLKGNLVPNLQHDFELFNGNHLPKELCCSCCLPLGAQQEVHSNLSSSSPNPSPKKKRMLLRLLISSSA
jgi:hypothetical protein